MGELRDWVRQVGFGLNMVITTKTSKKDISIVLHCQQSGRYRAAKKIVEGQDQPKSERIANRIKKIGCPFMLNGYYTRGVGWWLRVTAAFHNHPIEASLAGHTFASRLTKEQKEKNATYTASGTRPKDIVTTLSTQYPDQIITNSKVYKCKALQRIEAMGNLNVAQYSLKFLKDRGYFTYTNSEKDEAGNFVLTDLFISHPDAQHLLSMFSNVVIMDSTYKTNRYGMPLLEFVGFTSTSQTYCIAIVFMKGETMRHYTWALKRLKWLFREKRPICFMSDRELGAIKGVQTVFGDVRHLLCQVHVDRNVKAYAKLMKIDPTKFSSSVRRVMRSRSVEEYGEILAYFRDKWNSGAGGGLVRYVETTWLIPHKENLVCAWCDDILHFGTRTSNRVESQHSMLKDMLGSSVGGLDSIVEHIDNMFQNQVKDIKEEMGKSTHTVTRDILEGPYWIRRFFKCLMFRVSSVCLRLLLVQVVKAKNGEISVGEDPRDRWFSTTMGLPTPWKINNIDLMQRFLTAASARVALGLMQRFSPSNAAALVEE